MCNLCIILWHLYNKATCLSVVCLCHRPVHNFGPISKLFIFTESPWYGEGLKIIPRWIGARINNFLMYATFFTEFKNVSPNFAGKSCHSRYLFWLVFKKLSKIFLKLIKTNNMIGEIWRKNSKILCLCG